jgi:hypothetical protein
MFRIIRAAGMLVLATVVSPQNDASQDVPHATITQYGDTGGGVANVPVETDGSQGNATRAIPGPAASEEILSFRRRAYYYSWRGGCYTQDRNNNWYQVDPRLC